MHIYAEGSFCGVNTGSQRPKGLNVKDKLMIIDKLNCLDFFIVISEFFFVFFHNSVAKNHIAPRQPKIAEGHIRE